jgi:hypothetical protein
MNLEQAIKTLEYYQKWRLGAELDQPNPKDITEAIDIAINLLKPMKSPIK